MRLRKPRIKEDWDENRLQVTNPYGQKFVTGRDEALRIYDASVRVYNKRRGK